jgi:hypothetical protein
LGEREEGFWEKKKEEKWKEDRRDGSCGKNMKKTGVGRMEDWKDGRNKGGIRIEGEVFEKDEDEDEKMY